MDNKEFKVSEDKLKAVRQIYGLELELSGWLRPNNLKKFKGTVYGNKYNTYRAEIRTKNLGKSFKTKNEAEKYIRDNNTDDEVKNMYLICLDSNGVFLKVRGTQNQIFTIDYEDKHLLEKNICFCDKKGKMYYVLIKKSGTKYRLHNLILEHSDFSELTVDHINREPLNNRRYNLRLANKKQQGVNRSIRKDNILGIVGVSFRKDRQAYISHWTDENGNKCSSPSFFLKDYTDEEAKLLALEYRQNATKNLKHYQV